MFGVPSVHAEPSEAQRYRIEVRLDPVAHTLAGSASIHLHNFARVALRQLTFHLYLNAFRDARSVFMREGGARLRGTSLTKPGSITVTRLETAAGDDLLAGAARELVPGDFTQLRVTLPVPLPPKAALDLQVRWTAQLPEIVARSGYAGDFHMLGQWFPKLAKLESDGSFRSFPYHGFGEFYANFADYDCSITVPKRFVIAASGERIEQLERGSERTEHYRARRVIDFAWAADPAFETLSAQVGTTRVQLFAERGYGAALRRQGDVIAKALPYFEERYGRYPYPHLSVVIPPRAGHAASGMEYPTLFASDGPFWALPSWLPDPAQDVVATHELAHQWFACLLANDEVAHPMLDEGLAQWASLDFVRADYAPWIRLFGFGPFELMRAATLARPRKLPSSLLSADRYNAATLGPAVYARPALVLERIAERKGRPQLRAALERYAESQRFRHPEPDDLFAAFDRVFGRGFGTRVLKNALEGDDPRQLRAPVDEHAPKPSGLTLLPELWALVQTLLRWFGP
jgi:hypothetical protein